MQNPFLDEPIQKPDDFLLLNIWSVSEAQPFLLCHVGFLQFPVADRAPWQ